MPSTMITQKLLRERFDYSPETGLLTYKIAIGGAGIGHHAGSLNRFGYLWFECCGSDVRVHRAIFLYVYGRWPKEIDHINHIRTDNRLENLREVSGSFENQRNRTKSKNNTSGKMGVIFDKGRGKWRARIKINDVYLHIGWYADLADAVAAREAAEIQYGFHPNHGS